MFFHLAPWCDGVRSLCALGRDFFLRKENIGLRRKGEKEKKNS